MSFDPIRQLAPLLAALLLPLSAHAARLDTLSHLHGLAFDPADSSRLLIATHHGLYRAEPDGSVSRIGARRDDFMALAVDPSGPDRLFASGHPSTGGNLGLLRSDDAGASWQTWSQGHRGPVDFHQLTVSPADPQRLYGVHGTLQVSRDGGKSWQPVTEPPDKLIELAASGHDADRLYAATEEGLRVSLDGGHTWRAAAMYRNPASLVHAAADGTIYAFVLGRGLLRAREPSLAWEVLYNGFGSHYPLQMAVDLDDPQRLAVLSHSGRLFISVDGGVGWRRFGLPGPQARAVRGGRLFTEYCTVCHGVDGVGETAGTASAPADRRKLAPALDGSAHAWHHEDDQLVETILEGGIARGGRMPAWKTLLGEDDARDLVAYIKSLWGARELACQGAKHMNCDWRPEG